LSPIAGIPLVLACLGLQGFFSGSEIAMVSANRTRLTTRKEEGHRGSAIALDLLEHEELLLGTCLIGTNLCVISGTFLVSSMLHGAGVHSEWVVALAFVPFALILGEALPKTVYQYHANTIAPVVAFPLRALQGLFAPLLWVVTHWAGALRRLTGKAESTALSRAEILDLLEDPDIDPEETRMIRSIFEITKTPVEEVMTPLIDVHGVASNATVDDAITVALKSGHSRIPVFRERVDNIVGVLHAQDLLFGNRDGQTLEQMVRSVPFVPESKRVDALLNDMRRSPEHFAVVVDEYGGTVGVVTVEDLLEEIVGEIRDERERDEHTIMKIDDKRWRVPARAEVEHLEEVLGRPLPAGDYETVAGMLLEKFGHIPKVGEVVRIDDMIFRVEAASERAIGVVLLTIY